MKPREKFFSFSTHVMVALTISLIVNFSYLLAMLTYERDYMPAEARGDKTEIIDVKGTIRLNPDGYAYITGCDNPAIDSVYVQPWRLNHIEIADGDRIEARITATENPAAHYKMLVVKTVNGVDIDYGKIFNSPGNITGVILQILFYLAFSLLTAVVMTLRIRHNDYSLRTLVRRSAICIVIGVGIYLLAPVFDRSTWVLQPLFIARSGVLFDAIVFMKCSFTLVVAILYSFIYVLIFQRQRIVIENEHLQSENLTTRYNMLVSQINPHFLFNSLNSLAMLVRENYSDKALNYIDRMSYTFRYILQNGQNMTVTLREELKFVEAYSYLFKIRYEDKIFFDMHVSSEYLDRILPSLSLQPLIDNAVKHNTLTTRRPMHVTISVENGCLVVSNPKYPLLSPAAGTGTGLKNLRSRWQLIADVDIEICDTPDTFTVKLPLLKPEDTK